MKKNVLALSITAALVGLTGGAHAMTNTLGASAQVSEFNGGGVGHKLFVPYFSTQNNNNTLLNIINTDTANGKAVKVRFRGAANSDDIFDFQVFLSPGDVWTAQINQGLDGRSRFTTNDASCTKPEKSILNNTSFVTDRLDSTLTAAQKANGTHEGYIEILNMADIPKGARAAAGPVADVDNATTAGFAAVGVDNPLYTAIKHVNGIAPCATGGAAGTVAAASAAAWTFLDTTNLTYGAGPNNPTQAGLLPPSTGLMANWTIINVVGAAAYSGEAVSIENRDFPGVQATSPTSDSAFGRVNLGNVVYWPQTATLVDPGAGSGSAELFTADALFRSADVFKVSPATAVPPNTIAPAGPAAIKAAYYDLPDLSTPYNKTATSPLQQAKALTDALATRSVRNEFVTDKVISATTDWTFSQPTRRYNVAFNYGFPTAATAASATDDGRRFTNINADPTFAVTAHYAPSNTSVSSSTNGNGRQICVGSASINLTARDREEKPDGAPTVVVISPSTPVAAAKIIFCGEASVLSFNNGGILATGTGSLKASVAVQDADVTYGDGWATITTPAATTNLIGLPVVGSSFLRAVGSSGGQTFGAQYQHRLQR